MSEFHFPKEMKNLDNQKFNYHSSPSLHNPNHIDIIQSHPPQCDTESFQQLYGTIFWQGKLFSKSIRMFFLTIWSTQRQTLHRPAWLLRLVC